VLAQIATDAKSNEITAVPKLLAMLRLKGTIVTADALNCRRAIAQQIVDQGGDYAFALVAPLRLMKNAEFGSAKYIHPYIHLHLLFARGASKKR